MTWYLRAPGLVATTSQATCIVCVPEREPARLDDVDAALLSVVLGRSASPVSKAELETIADADAIDSLVALGVLVVGATEAKLALYVSPSPTNAKRCKRVVVGLTGSIATVSALPFIIDLADHFAEQVDVIVGEGAQNFVIPEVYGYYGFRVWTDPFEPRHGVAVPHAELADNADAVLVAPCSANTLHKLASGACSDLVSLVVAATKAPVIVAPSTNANMWAHPPVQRNVAQLRADGVWIVEPWRGSRVAKRGERGIGGLGFNSFGLFRILDLLLPPPAR